jgi:hypothetical protein
MTLRWLVRCGAPKHPTYNACFENESENESENEPENKDVILLLSVSFF